MPDIHEIALAYRALLIARDQRLRLALEEDYLAVLAALERETQAALADLTASPGTVVWRVERARQMEERLREYLADYGADAAPAIEIAQARAAALSVEAQAAQFEAVSISFHAPSKRAIEALSGFASDGSPLAELFAEVAADSAVAMRDALLTGVALGHGTDDIAKRLEGEFDVPVIRAQRIARTETLRAYREGNRLSMLENSKVISGWQWLSARDWRACPVCWAMDGTVHPLSEPFYSHVACRCVPTPVVEGVPDDYETGPQAFAKLTPEQQEEILGPGKYALYRRGAISLSDLVINGTDARWGPYRVERPLKALGA